MTIAAAELLGFVPSLEVLPLFGNTSAPAPFALKAHASYGEIARSMLTRRLAGGIIPWEIFVTDVLALPGQRAAWKVLLFLHPCPTELFLREPIYKAFYPLGTGGKLKLPRKLTVAVESRNSLTIVQAQEWLGRWNGSAATELSFKMLPMDLMLQAIEAEAVDATIAPSPWGKQMELNAIGRCDPLFTSCKYGQQVVIVCHRNFLEDHPDLIRNLPEFIANSRNSQTISDEFRIAADKMSLAGKPSLDFTLLAQASTAHRASTISLDTLPNPGKLLTELIALDKFSALPAQVSASEQTARLLDPG